MSILAVSLAHEPKRWPLHTIFVVEAVANREGKERDQRGGASKERDPVMLAPFLYFFFAPVEVSGIEPPRLPLLFLWDQWSVRIIWKTSSCESRQVSSNYGCKEVDTGLSSESFIYGLAWPLKPHAQKVPLALPRWWNVTTFSISNNLGKIISTLRYGDVQDSRANCCRKSRVYIHLQMDFSIENGKISHCHVSLLI